MRYKIVHITNYKYGETIDLCHNQLRLKPRDFEGQKLIDYSLEISPIPSDESQFIDFFGNHVYFFAVQQSHNELIVKSQCTVDRDIRYLDFTEISRMNLTETLDLLQDTDDQTREARQYIFNSKYIEVSPKIKRYAKQSFRPHWSLYHSVNELIQRVFSDFKFVPGFTTISTPLSKVFEEKKGVCQDFAHFAIACLRSMGLPARYVSGYIETIPQPGEKKLTGVDASHAWISVFFPKFGWIDFDPTNNLLVGNNHITIGWGTDYFDILPVKGVIFSYGNSLLKVSVDMERI